MNTVTRYYVSTLKDEELKSLLSELFNQLSFNPPESVAYQHALASLDAVRRELHARLYPKI